MRRVTGIGGIFFKSANPDKLKKWYVKHLGLPEVLGKYIVFSWGKDKEFSHSVFEPFSKHSDYFSPSTKSVMFNFRVENLDKLLETLKIEGVEIVGEIESYDYGKFGWIMDPEGHKIELWEPNDAVFRKINEMDK